VRELGGYIEFEHYHGAMLHEEGVALNCGRNGLAYLIEAKGIRRMALPYFNCDTVAAVCRRMGVTIRYYHSGADFLPEDVVLEPGEWLYLVNYYGQIGNQQIARLQAHYGRLIVDNAQAYFAESVDGVPTIYTCRKFFGVADGAFVMTDARLGHELPRDESYQRMGFLLGRFERTASEFYKDYVANNTFFDNEPVKRMSKLTTNLLRGLDYDAIRRRREENFAYLGQRFHKQNELSLVCSPGPFMYPLLLRGGRELRKQLQAQKIYIPTLWPDVFDICQPEDREYDWAANILPLPVDQRYDVEDMAELADAVEEALGVKNERG